MSGSDWRIVHNSFPKVKKQLRQAADDIIGETAFMCEDYAKSDPPEGGPVDTGTMVGEVTSEHVPGSMRSETNANAEYSGFVNYGTVYMAANPWFDRAIAHATSYYNKELAAIEKKLG